MLCSGLSGSDGSDASGNGSHALLHYLLLGRSGLDVLSAPPPSHSAAGDAAAVAAEPEEGGGLDEVMMVISATGVGLYCTPPWKPAFEKLLSRVEGARILCRAAGEFGEEADEDEIFKIHAFLELTKGIKRVIVPVLADPAAAAAAATSSSKSSKHPQDPEMALKMSLESWPIVQASGLDEMGRHGFFTLTRSVAVCNLAQFERLADVDGAHVLALLTNCVPAFNNQVQSTVGRLLNLAAAALDSAPVRPVAASSSSSASALAAVPALPRDVTLGQLNADLRTFWEYGVESLAGERERAQRRAADLEAPSGLFFFGAAAGDSTTMVRCAGLKHYASLSGYYNKLFQAHPYLPLDSLLPSFSSWTTAPLHALLRLTDPLSSLSVVRTVILRQTTPVQENEIEVLQHLTPQAWKRKKKRIVKGEDDGGNASSSSSVGSEADSADDQSESEEDASSSEDESSDIHSDEEERKATKPTKAANTKAKPKPKPVPPRLKTESPGLRDSMLLSHLYAILVQVSGQVLREILTSPAPPSSSSPSTSSSVAVAAAASFPSFTMIRDRIVAAVQHLFNAKWVLRSFFDALRTQSKPAGAIASANGGILGMELYRIDAFGRRAACDLSAPVALAPAEGQQRSLFSFALYLHRIPSLELQSLTDDNDVLLGSVGFGESFVWDEGLRSLSGTSSVASTRSSLSAEELAEEQRQREDPTYFGTGLTSSSAINTNAASSAAESAPANTASSSMLVLTAGIPSLIPLPSFFQLFEAKCVAALVSSYAHASPPPHVSWSPAEVAAKGLVPVHASLGRFLLDAATPKVPETILLQPPTSALVGVGARMRLFDPLGYTPAVFVGGRNDLGSRALLLQRNDAWLCSSPLGGVPCSLMLGSHGGLTPILHGQLVAFERGFVFHSSSVGSLIVDFGKHVLETAFYDGSGEEWEKDDDDAAAEDSEASDDDPDSDTEGEDSINDALFSIDLLEPANEAEAASTPYTLLRSLQSPALAHLSKLAPLTGNTGVTPAPSKFARAFASLALLLPKSSSLSKFWVSSLQSTWGSSLESLNIHNDIVDEIPAWCRESYEQTQEQHRFQRRELRKSKQREREQQSKRAKEHDDEHDEDEEGGNDANSPALLKFSAPKLVLPDATCDFLADYRVHELMRDQTDVKRVQEASMLLSKRAHAASKPVVVTSTSAAIPVSLVVGVPSSGHSSLLGSVRNHDSKFAVGSSSTAGGVTRWSTLMLGGGDDAFSIDSSASAAARTSAAIADLKARVAAIAAQHPHAKQRVMVVVSSYCGVRSVVDWLHSVLLVLSSAVPSFRLSTVIALLSASNFFVGPSHSLTYPGVVDQMVAGYTASCLLLTPPLPLSSRETDLIAAVRARIRACHPAGSDLRVATAGTRIAFKDVESMLLRERWGSDSAIRRRVALQLLEFKEAGSSSIPRLLSVVSQGRAFLFHFSPSSFLFDRNNFLAALSSFTCQRSIYHSDAEREEERKHNQVQLARANAAAMAATGGVGVAKHVAPHAHAGASSSSSSASASASAAASASGRIVFTTSSSSLPSSYTVISVQSLLKFEDSFSNAGRVSHRFLEVYAAQGRVDLKSRNFATREPRKTVQAAADSAASGSIEAEQADEMDERKDSDKPDVDVAVDPAEDLDAPCPIPLSAIPVDIVQAMDAAAAAPVSSSSSAAAATAQPPLPSTLTTASTSCLLLVYGLGLSRSDVARDLLHPSLRNTRSYERADSAWNAEVRRQQADIMREGQ